MGVAAYGVEEAADVVGDLRAGVEDLADVLVHLIGERWVGFLSEYGTKEMMKPCLIYLHMSSLWLHVTWLLRG